MLTGQRAKINDGQFTPEFAEGEAGVPMTQLTFDSCGQSQMRFIVNMKNLARDVRGGI
jgi:hypothetical protein